MAISTISSADDPIFFFREIEEPYGFLSQWYASTFTAPAPPSEGALLFDDQEIADKIMLECSPRKQKALGRKVRDFDPKRWDEKKEQMVEDGSWWKMTQSKQVDMRRMLLDTGSRELVEASPLDRIWGIGYAAGYAESNRGKWGENLLGKALIRVRDRLQAEEQVANNISRGTEATST